MQPLHLRFGLRKLLFKTNCVWPRVTHAVNRFLTPRFICAISTVVVYYILGALLGIISFRDFRIKSISHFQLLLILWPGPSSFINADSDNWLFHYSRATRQLKMLFRDWTLNHGTTFWSYRLALASGHNQPPLSQLISPESHDQAICISNMSNFMDFCVFF